MVQPTGIGGPRVTQTLTALRAWGEIMGVPPGQLDVIIGKARLELEFQPDSPGSPPGPPAPPPIP